MVTSVTVTVSCHKTSIRQKKQAGTVCSARLNINGVGYSAVQKRLSFVLRVG